jgi:hypothetical protein
MGTDGVAVSVVRASPAGKYPALTKQAFITMWDPITFAKLDSFEAGWASKSNAHRVLGAASLGAEVLIWSDAELWTVDRKSKKTTAKVVTDYDVGAVTLVDAHRFVASSWSELKHIYELGVYERLSE